MTGGPSEMRQMDFNPIKRAEEIAKGFVDLVKEMEAKHEMDRKPQKTLMKRGTIEVYDLNERGEFLATYTEDDRKVEINGKPVPNRPKQVNGLGLTPYGAIESLSDGMLAEKVLG